MVKANPNTGASSGLVFLFFLELTEDILGYYTTLHACFIGYGLLAGFGSRIFYSMFMGFESFTYITFVLPLWHLISFPLLPIFILSFTAWKMACKPRMTHLYYL